jgi:hypothetical protein
MNNFSPQQMFQKWWLEHGVDQTKKFTSELAYVAGAESKQEQLHNLAKLTWQAIDLLSRHSPAEALTIRQHWQQPEVTVEAEPSDWDSW